jgi:hypothetical protein
MLHSILVDERLACTDRNREGLGLDTPQLAANPHGPTTLSQVDADEASATHGFAIDPHVDRSSLQAEVEPSHT